MDLHPQILKGVKSLGFEKPFPIQELTIGPLLSGRNVIGQAKTGSGKTAAFGLPLLQKINEDSWDVQALVLAPTRELAVQITAELKKLAAFTRIKLVTIYGGQSINVQFESLDRGVHVVVGTPGRIMDHLKRGSLDLSRVKYVVLDEADTMLDMGFIEDIEFILDSVPEPRQMSLFSATMPRRIMDIANKYMHDAQKILVSADEPTVDTLEQFYAMVEQKDKEGVLLDLLEKEKPRSAIIFCRTKYGAHKLARELQRNYINAVPLHGDLSQHQRDHSMGVFRSGHADVLVATDVASRGIDISQVDCIINYDVPEDPVLYFHRVGRTARAGASGKAFTLVSYEEDTDFARIMGLTKAVIKPMRPEDAEHNFYVNTRGTITELQNQRHGGGGRRGYSSGYRGRARGGYNNSGRGNSSSSNESRGGSWRGSRW
jgi:ATP-dependent RNA helicase DeaD